MNECSDEISAYRADSIQNIRKNLSLDANGFTTILYFRILILKLEVLDRLLAYFWEWS